MRSMMLVVMFLISLFTTGCAMHRGENKAEIEAIRRAVTQHLTDIDTGHGDLLLRIQSSTNLTNICSLNNKLKKLKEVESVYKINQGLPFDRDGKLWNEIQTRINATEREFVVSGYTLVTKGSHIICYNDDSSVVLVERIAVFIDKHKLQGYDPKVLRGALRQAFTEDLKPYLSRLKEQPNNEEVIGAIQNIIHEAIKREFDLREIGVPPDVTEKLRL